MRITKDDFPEVAGSKGGPDASEHVELARVGREISNLIGEHRARLRATSRRPDGDMRQQDNPHLTREAGCG